MGLRHGARRGPAARRRCPVRARQLPRQGGVAAGATPLPPARRNREPPPSAGALRCCGKSAGEGGARRREARGDGRVVVCNPESGRSGSGRSSASCTALSRRPPEPGPQPPTLGPWQRGRANNQRESRSNAVLCHWLGAPAVLNEWEGRQRGGKGPRCYLQCDSLQKEPQIVSILRVILWVNCATGSSIAGLQTEFNDFGTGRVLLKNATCCNSTNNSCKKHSACQK